MCHNVQIERFTLFTAICSRGDSLSNFDTSSKIIERKNFINLYIDNKLALQRYYLCLYHERKRGKNGLL